MSDNKIISRTKDFLMAHRADLWLVLSLIFVAIVSLILLFTLRTEGDIVEVEIDGEIVATYSLSADGEYEIGEGNILTIKDGKAYMSYADCPDKTCVKTRAISNSGESIICLPNRVSVRVVAEDNGGADLIS